MSFHNTGRQLKTWAVVFRWLCIVVGLILTIYGVVQATSGRSVQEAASVTTLTWGLSLMVVGWVGSLALYGFGIIVAANEEKTEGASASPALSQAHTIEPIFKDQPAYTRKPTNSSGWRCSRCDTMNPNHLGTCPQCGEVKPAKN